MVINTIKKQYIIYYKYEYKTMGSRFMGTYTHYNL